MRPEVARALLLLASIPGDPFRAHSIDAEIWRAYELVFRDHYADEREAALCRQLEHFVDHGGESG